MIHLYELVASILIVCLDLDYRKTFQVGSNLILVRSRKGWKQTLCHFECLSQPQSRW